MHKFAFWTQVPNFSYYVGQNQEGQGLLRDDHLQEPQLLMSGVSNLTTEMQPRGINLNLSHNETEQVVRIVFNVPNATAGQ